MTDVSIFILISFICTLFLAFLAHHIPYYKPTYPYTSRERRLLMSLSPRKTKLMDCLLFSLLAYFTLLKDIILLGIGAGFLLSAHIILYLTIRKFKQTLLLALPAIVVLPFTYSFSNTLKSACLVLFSAYTFIFLYFLYEEKI